MFKGLIFGWALFGGAYIWNEVSVSTCGGLIHGGAYIRGGANSRRFTVYNYWGIYPVGCLLAPVAKHNFHMNWALLIIIKRLALLKKLLLPAFSLPLTFSILIPSYKSQHRQGRC